MILSNIYIMINHNVCLIISLDYNTSYLNYFVLHLLMVSKIPCRRRKYTHTHTHTHFQDCLEMSLRFGVYEIRECVCEFFSWLNVITITGSCCQLTSLSLSFTEGCSGIYLLVPWFFLQWIWEYEMVLFIIKKWLSQQ